MGGGLQKFPNIYRKKLKMAQNKKIAPKFWGATKMFTFLGMAMKIFAFLGWAMKIFAFLWCAMKIFTFSGGGA